MSTAYPKGGAWYIAYKGPDGRRVARKTAAITKTEAKKLAAEAERDAERTRLDVERNGGAGATMTMGKLAEWWLVTYSPALRDHRNNLGSITKHLMPSPLAKLCAAQVEAGHIEVWLHDLTDKLAPQTVNRMRKYLARIYNAARRAGLLKRVSPVIDTRKRQVSKRLHDYLRPAEVSPVLAALPLRWRDMFAAAIYTAMREGELASLAIHDVDLGMRLIHVKTSWGEETKGRHEDAIPIAKELIPYLRHAIGDRRAGLVFPAPGGGMVSRNTSLSRVLRSALGRAGIADGWKHKCRRCGHAETAKTGEVRECLYGCMKMWPTALVRKIRFHDLRHTTASLLIMFGVDVLTVKRICRHTDVSITEGYIHLSPEYMRAAIDKLRFSYPGATSESSDSSPTVGTEKPEDNP